MPEWASAETPPVPAEGLPDWLAEPDATVSAEEIPDWLAEAEAEVQPEEIPAWLLDTVETEMPAEEELPSAPAQAAVPPPAPPAPKVEPVPVPVPPRVVPAAPPPAADVAATLQTAREKASSGDLDGSLREYERVIRSNSGLEHVSADLTQLLEGQAENPAVYRVLGDCQMRQGQLQTALDTYRKALNQL